MRRFAIATLGQPGDQLALDAEMSHHLLHVVRATRGAELVVFEIDSGLQATARLVDVRDAVAIVEQLDSAVLARPTHERHLVLAVARGPAMDTAVRMATELGVTHFHPLLASRSTARGDRGDRWLRIARSASQQCGRADVPEFHPARPLDAILSTLPTGVPAFVATPEATAPPSRVLGHAIALIGPEGGFTHDELQRCIAWGAAPVSLGTWVLRVETAAAALLAGL